MNVVVCGTDKKHLGKQITMQGVARHRHLKGLFVSSFSSFFISFREIQKLNDSKNEKLEAHFHEFLNFLLFRPSSFWISRKLIPKSDKKLKQTGPKAESETTGEVAQHKH
jgi:hypothetical protein